MQSDPELFFWSDPDLKRFRLSWQCFSVVDRHHSDADPDPTFQFDTDPDQDPLPSFTHVGKSENFDLNWFTLNDSSTSLHCFIFLVGVIDVKIFNIWKTNQYFGIFWKKVV
jgi:hypothetical protein